MAFSMRNHGTNAADLRRADVTDTFAHPGRVQYKKSDGRVGKFIMYATPRCDVLL